MSTYRVPIVHTYAGAGGPGLNVWHVRTTGDEVPSGSDLQALVQIIRDFYTAVAIIFPSTSVLTYGGVATTIGDDPQYDASAPAWSVQGSGQSSTLSPLLQICVGWLTTSASRSGRGRTFLGPLSAQVQEANGTPTGTALGVVRAAALELVADSAGFANGAVTVYSPTQDLARDITGSATRDVFAYLSSRRD